MCKMPPRQSLRGGEIDGRWQISGILMLAGSLGWIDFDFDVAQDQEQLLHSLVCRSQGLRLVQIQYGGFDAFRSSSFG